MGCKVDTLVERHEITISDPGYDSVDEYLVARWTGSDGRSAQGYKSLTEWFNKRVLERIYEAHGRDTIGVHLEREYDVIDGESAASRDELAADLATDGIDIEAVESEFVSWSTVRHHLKGCLDAEKETQTAGTDWESNTVEVARERTVEKAQSALKSLSAKDQLPKADEADIQVQVKLACPDCSVRVPFEEAIDRGYICETHSETAETESTRERWRNSLSSLVAPYAAMEAVSALLFEEAVLLETAAVSVF